MAIDVLCSGYVSMDHMIKIDSSAKPGFTSIVTNKSNTQAFCGGCSVNIAYALSRLGVAAAPVVRVGQDCETCGFMDYMEAGNVCLDGVRVIEGENTSVSYLIQDANNDHITCFYPGAMDEKYYKPFDEELFDGVKLGVVTVAPKKDNEDFFRICKKKNIPVCFGMKDDFTAFPHDFLKEILLGAEIIFTNEVEREVIEKRYGWESICDVFELGEARYIITTLGAQGSLIHYKSQDRIVKVHVPACEIDEIVDATGGGDAYMAGFIYGWLKGESPERCAALGSKLSWFVLQDWGCTTNAPSEQQLLEQMGE